MKGDKVMADKSISSLTQASEFTDASLLVLYQDSETKAMTGGVLRQYVENSAAPSVAAARQAQAQAEAAATSAEQAVAAAISAKSAAEQAESAATGAANLAISKANEAAKSASNANTYASDAFTSSGYAQHAQTAAETAKTAAETSASAAAQSAKDAAAAVPEDYSTLVDTVERMVETGDAIMQTNKVSKRGVQESDGSYIFKSTNSLGVAIFSVDGGATYTADKNLPSPSSYGMLWTTEAVDFTQGYTVDPAIVAGYTQENVGTENPKFTAPDNAKYLYYTVAIADADTVTLRRESIRPAMLPPEVFAGETAALALTWTNRYRYDTVNETFGSTSAAAVTGFVPIPGGCVIRVNQDFASARYGHAVYDANQVIVAGVPSNAYNRTFRVPEDARYIRFTAQAATKDSFRAEVLGRADEALYEAESQNPYRRYGVAPMIKRAGINPHNAFPSVACFKGRTVVLYLNGSTHFPTDGTAQLIAAQRTPDGVWTSTPIDLSSIPYDGEIREGYITAAPDGESLYLVTNTLIAAEGGGYTTNSIIARLDASLTVTDHWLDQTGNVVLCGNTLVTPQGHVIVSAYNYSNRNIVLYRSSAPVTSLTGATFETIPICTDYRTASECCIGYAGSRLLCMIRQEETNAAYGVTDDPEGLTGWTYGLFADSAVIHSPRLLPVCSGTLIPFAGTQRISGELRYPIIGLLDAAGTPAIKCYANIDEDIFDYSGYLDIAQINDLEFDAAYYVENQHSLVRTPGLPSGVYYKRVDMRQYIGQLGYYL